MTGSIGAMELAVMLVVAWMTFGPRRPRGPRVPVMAKTGFVPCRSSAPSRGRRLAGARREPGKEPRS